MDVRNYVAQLNWQTYLLREVIVWNASDTLNTIGIAAREERGILPRYAIG